MRLLHLRFLSLLTLLYPSFTSASFLPHRPVRPTFTSDLIGLYNIHPETDIAARPNNCPVNLTTDTFEFQVSRAPSSLAAPKFFNIQIDHRNTVVSGRRCESTGSIVATTSSHPFAEGHALEIITTWSAAGRTRPARWISQDFIEFIAKQSFAVGYDFVERSCRGVRVRPGVGYLWLQPARDIQLGFPGSPGLTLSARNKYLLLTFARDPWSGCVFVADSLGGEAGFPPGPVSDPSLDEEVDPDTIPTDDDDTPKPPTPVPDETSSETEEGSSPEPASEDLPVLDDDPADDQPAGDEPADDEVTGDESASDQDTDDDDGRPDDVSSIFTSGDDDDPVEEPACFPASALVELQDGSIIQVAHLEVGHKVRISDSGYSDIFFFSHRQIEQNTQHSFIKITTTNQRQLTVSPDHYLYVNHMVVAARNVRIGDILYSADGGELSVRGVENVKEEGLIAPHTLHGDIVVNGIRASTYTAAVHPHLAHYVLLAPVRVLYRLGLPGLLNGVLDSGADRLRRLIPRGPELMNRFL